MAAVSFDLIQPDSLKKALKTLSELGQKAQLIAGGTDLLRDIRVGVKAPQVIVSLDRLSKLRGIRNGKPDGLAIGSLTTMAELATSSKVRKQLTALWEAASQMGSPQVRNRATFGGNLCNARPCADSAPPAMVLDGILILKNLQGNREVRADEFIQGPGKTVKKPDEILEQIVFHKLPNKTGSAFISAHNRKAVEITITSAAARISLHPDEVIQEAKICLGSVGPTPLLAKTAEKALLNQKPTQELFEKAAKAAVEDASPIDDFRGSAAYRKWMVEVLVKRALETAYARIDRGVR